MKKILLLMSSILAGSGLMSAASFGSSPLGSNQFEASGLKITPSQVADMNKATRADEESYIDFTYAGEPENAYALNGISSGFMYLAFKMPVADQTPYIGAKITGISFYSPGNSNGTNNPVSTARVFVTDDISKAPTQTTKADLSSTALEYNYVALDTPFEITGEKPLFIGYRFQYVANSYYMVVDEKLTPATQMSCLVANVSKVTEAPSFSNFSDQIGSLCISIRIAGENLPENVANVVGLDIPEYCAPDSPITYYPEVKNMGVNAINTLTFTTTIEGETTETEYTFDTPLGVGQKQQITISDVPNNVSGFSSLTASCVKANGVEIENPASFSGNIASYASDIPHCVVLEEGTGNWCGWCPAGIVMMEYVKEAYPDWIRIAVHGDSTEPMFVTDYAGFLNTYAPGFPTVMVNRYVDFNPTGTGDNPEFYSLLNEYYSSIPSYVATQIEAVTSEDGKSIDVTAKSSFLLDLNINHKLSIVIVEDGVGPYNQTNYYAGGSSGKMGGWERKGSPVSTLYDDVARAILPDINVFPAQIVKDTEYVHTANMPLSYTYGKKPNNKGAGTVINPANARVVAFITNTETGEIVGASEASITLTGVKDAIADEANVSVAVEGGSIIVNGTDNFAVYSLDGRQVSAKDVPAGVYVVKTAGKSFKVLVK